MKTLIVGTGIIGVIYGWALAEAGVDVTHFVRPGRKAQFTGGVTLDLLDERKGHPPKSHYQYALKCVEEIGPADGYELIVVPTNSYQTEEVLRLLAPKAGDAIFLILALIWEGTGFIDGLLPRDRYLLGYPDGGGTRRDGVYWTNLGAEIHLGEVDGQPSEKLNRIKALFEQADMQPDLPSSIVHWLWLHEALALGIWAAFAKYRDLKIFLKDRPLLVESYHATREVVELCRRRGINLKDYPDASFVNLPAWVFVPMFRWLYRHNESMQRFTAHAADSLTEGKANVFAVLQTGQEMGLDMPYLRKLSAYMKDVP